MYGLFAAVLVLAAWRVDARLWGVHHLAFVSPAYAWGAALVLAVLLHPRVAEHVAGAATGIGSRAVGSQPIMLATAGIVLVACHFNRVEFHFLGDGLAWSNGLRAGNFFYSFEPLAAALTRAFAETAEGENPVQRAATLSVVLGAAYVFGTARLCTTLWSEPHARGTAWALLVFHPILLLYCGYIESYPILIVVQVFYLWALVASGRGRCPLVVPVLTAAVALAAHVSALPWLLALVVVADARAATKQGVRALPLRERLRSPSHLARIAAAPASALVLAMLLIAWVGVHPQSLLTKLSGATGLGGQSWSWMFSAHHVVDVANELALLLAPALVLLAPAMRRRWRTVGVEWYVVLAVLVGPVATVLVIEPRIGGARDWDLFTPLAPPAILLCVEAWRRLSRGVARVSAGRAVGLSLVATLAWLAVGVSAERSAQRFEVWQSPNALLSNHARGYMNETLGIYHRNGDGVAARDAWQRAAAANPNNPRYFNSLGNATARLGEHEAACAAYWRALELGMQRYHLLFNVAGCARRNKEYARADSLLSILVQREPERFEAWSDRGFVRLRLGRPQEALSDLQEAITHEPRDAVTWFRAGLAHVELGDTERARAAWQKTLEIQPQHAGARRRLNETN